MTMVAFYKFCYWLGVKAGIRRLEVWSYLNWFRVEGTEDIMAYFAFADNYFKFCQRWRISPRVGK